MEPHSDSAFPLTPRNNRHITRYTMPSSPMILASSSMPESMPSVTRMDLFTSKGTSRNGTKAVRLERYDPCCTISQSQIPTKAIRFDKGLVRKRALSEHCLKSSSPLSLPLSLPLPHRNLRKGCTGSEHNRTPLTHNRRRATSGPLVGTTVLVANLSNASFDSDEGSEETMSSLEEVDLDKRRKVKSLILPELPNRKLFATTRKADSCPTIYPQKEENANNPKVICRSSSFMKLPLFLTGSRRRKSSVQPLGALASLQRDVENAFPHRESRKADISMRSRSTARKRFVHLVTFISLGVILFASSNSTSDTGGIDRAKVPVREKNIEDIRTVQNFSGEWGLTLTDARVENSDKSNGNVREKRQPRLAEANSLSTQHLSTRMETKKFVLTDDDIRKKTNSVGDVSFIKNRRHRSHPQGTGKETSTALVMFAWIFFLLAGIDTIVGEIYKRRSQIRKMQSSEESPIRFAPSLSQHAHYP